MHRLITNVEYIPELIKYRSAQGHILYGDATRLYPSAFEVQFVTEDSEANFYRQLYRTWKDVPITPFYFTTYKGVQPTVGSAPQQVIFSSDNPPNNVIITANPRARSLADSLDEIDPETIMQTILYLVQMYDMLLSRGIRFIHGQLSAANILMVEYGVNKYWPLLTNFGHSELQSSNVNLKGQLNGQRTMSGLEDFYHLILDILARYQADSGTHIPEFLTLYRALGFFFPNLSTDQLSTPITNRVKEGFFFDSMQIRFTADLSFSDLIQFWKNEYPIDSELNLPSVMKRLAPAWMQQLESSPFSIKYRQSSEYQHYSQLVASLNIGWPGY